MKSKICYSLFALACICFLLQCTSNTENKKGEQQVTSDTINIDKKFDSLANSGTIKILYSLPSPMEMMRLIERTKTGFYDDFINPAANIDKYMTASSLALNLGVYGVDVGYLRSYNQMQKAINYFAVIKRITGKLGIPDEQSTSTIKALEDGNLDKTKMMQIISDIYKSADSYLRENDRESTAALIILGGWVEGMYIAANTLQNEKSNKALANRIAEQKYSLNTIIKLLSDNEENKTIGEFLPKMYLLKKVYDKIELRYKQVNIDTANKMLIITNEEPQNINMNDIESIGKIIASIRSQIISY